MRIFDSHAHYCDARFDEDRALVLDAQFAFGVERILEVGCDPADFERVLALAAQYPGIYCALGIHPHEAGKAGEEALSSLAHLLQTHEKAVALGEIGLDYHYDFFPRSVQCRAFEEQLALARRLDLPVVLHVREAYGDAMDILHGHKQGLKGVMHCFSGSPEIARQCVDMGLYVAFGGSLTFHNARKVVESAAAVPLERLLIETDCPYMAPVPHRGERNESRLLPFVLKRLAEIHGVEEEVLAEATYRNACAAFGLRNA
ncbi:MAG: TatD family deoxyribonuclease [Clostridia bacterium]|nr:TatD family hydrolase [Candidatus Pelethousia sp.]NCB31719.1 TatD family deoxyribonuclease [Clostridia bacterium]